MRIGFLDIEILGLEYYLAWQTQVSKQLSLLSLSLFQHSNLALVWAILFFGGHNGFNYG